MTTTFKFIASLIGLAVIFLLIVNSVKSAETIFTDNPTKKTKRKVFAKALALYSILVILWVVTLAVFPSEKDAVLTTEISLVIIIPVYLVTYHVAWKYLRLINKTPTNGNQD